MAHADVALDIERWTPGEAERLHVGVHLGLEHAVLAERPLERTDELLVHRTSGERNNATLVRRTAARSVDGAGIDLASSSLTYECTAAATERFCACSGAV